MPQTTIFSTRTECIFCFLCVASLVLCAIAVTWANLHNVNIAMVTTRADDEYDFTWILENMYGGMLALNPRDFFKIGFYNYGFPYFFLELILLIPAQIAHSYEAMLVIQRSFSLAWAIGVLALAGWWIRRRTGSWGWSLMVIWLLIAMPGFINMTTIAHPDTMMAFFLLAAFVAAAERNAGRWRDVVIVGILCGLGACAKIQIAIYVPFVAALFFWRALAADPAFPGLPIRSIKVAALIVFLTPLTYLVLNPFLLNKTAMKHFIALFKENMESNATNHFHYNLPTAAEKLGMLSHYYFPVALTAVVALITLAILVYRRVRLVEIAPELVMLACGVVTCLYVFITVQKLWDSYYLPSFTLIAVSLVPLWWRIAVRNEALLSRGLVAALAVFLLMLFVRTPAAVAQRIVDDGPRARAMAPLNSLMAGVMRHTTGKHVLTSPKTFFQFQKLGLRFTQITFIPGEEVLDQSELNTTDILLLRKNDIYFAPSYLNSATPKGAAVRQVRRQIDAMHAGKDLVFVLCGENGADVVFCRRSTYEASRT